MEVYLAQPRGFCAGVVRAIEIVERALEKYGPPVYVRHEIVHNKYVVESLKNKGAIFVEDLSEVPPLAVTVFSAHGVARSVEEEAAARSLPTEIAQNAERQQEWSSGPYRDNERLANPARFHRVRFFVSRLFSRSTRSQEMLSSEGISAAISV